MERPPEPWLSFPKNLDDAVEEIATLDCIGGFVVSRLYGLARATAALNVIEIAPRDAGATLAEKGILGSDLFGAAG